MTGRDQGIGVASGEGQPVNTITRKFELILISIGLLDLCLWVLTFSMSSNALWPTIFVFVRSGCMVAIAYLFYPGRSAPVPAILTLVLFVSFSLFGIFAILSVLKHAEQNESPGGSLYHIDNEEGEQADSGNVPEESLSIDEMRRVSPLIDGMTDENKNSRIAAIQAMERVSGSPAIRGILREAKLDSHKEVQYYANDALNKINDGYMDQIKEQLNQLNSVEDPEVTDYLRLADLYSAVAGARIDHPVLLHFYAHEAIKYYSYVLEKIPQSADESAESSSIRLGTLKKFLPTLYYNNEFEDCLRHCEIASQISSLEMFARQYQARCLFKLKKMAALREFSREHSGTGIASIDAFLELEESL